MAWLLFGTNSVAGFSSGVLVNMWKKQAADDMKIRRAHAIATNRKNRRRQSEADVFDTDFSNQFFALLAASIKNG